LTPGRDGRRRSRVAQWSARIVVILPVATLALAAAPRASAADSSSWRRWSLGVNVSTHSTSDNYRSNAAIVQTKMFGADGIPGTGDAGEVVTCISLIPGYYPEVDPFCDPRSDDLVAREGSVHDTIGLGIEAGFELTRWLQLRFDARYYQSEVGDIDVYATETVPVFQPDGRVLQLADRSRSDPIPAGELTQIPLSLSLIVRFMPGKPFRPYLGAGAGIISTSFAMDDQVGALETELRAQHLRGIANERGRNITPEGQRSDFEFNGGLLRFEEDITVEVDDAREWHLDGGFEYVINDRFSLVFAARYAFADQEVKVEIGDEDQVDLFTWPLDIFYPNGTLKVFSPTGGPPNPFCIDVPAGAGCGQNAPSDKRITPLDIPGFVCPGKGDFDRNFSFDDACYPAGALSPSGRDILGMWVVQGGSIDLTAFSLAVGVRVHL
jgi:hypothetical protein